MPTDTEMITLLTRAMTETVDVAKRGARNHPEAVCATADLLETMAIEMAKTAAELRRLATTPRH